MSRVVVTGATSGIGLATVLRLSADGHRVWAGARQPDGADDLHKALADLEPGQATVVPLDVDDEASVAAAFGTIQQEGPVDVLVNNAGVSGAGTVEETPLGEFRRQMETNYFGLLRCTQAVVEPMRRRGHGCIVNVGSLAGRFVRPAMGAYAASKHAVEALSEALAQELAPFGVRVRIIEPGVVATRIWQRSSPPAPDTAYPLAAAQTMAYYARMLADPAPPSAVADAIAAAITDDGPGLRTLVGWDAEAIATRRPHIADEDLVAMSGLEVDAWKAAWAELFGFGLD